jgi:hypothetical protein
MTAYRILRHRIEQFLALCRSTNYKMTTNA